MPEAEHVMDPQLRQKILSGEQRTTHAQWANNRPGVKSKNNNNKKVQDLSKKLRSATKAHSNNPNAQQPREIPEGYIRPPPGIRKLTPQEWEERKKSLRKMERELERNLDYTDNADYNFGDEDWENLYAKYGDGAGIKTT